ncbi:coiled-coil domain-containing protein 178 [Sphaeramia orbicularis]|uniref:coiled-coil domain-containing protein 178 n=1 Tax=Sphaeramia orbicularis TaxID=375764 RepID=UPI00117D4396|nr:coiled-coil domain-containing protein 178 [Sphaeramia orbicularis]
MPDVEPLRFPSREGRPSQQDQADLQGVCSGRRRTCALLNSPLPCVNSAIYHIQELRMEVDNWFQQSGKYPHQIDLEKHRYAQNLRFKSRDSDSESVTSTDLAIEGIGIGARESSSLSPLLKKINDVLGEVVYLIERLEADRQYAEETLLKEKRRKKFLENKIDSIYLWKHQEHSLVVQKEHEACSRDIAELKWQLKQEREKLEQVQDKLSQTEVVNQHLQEDINIARKQIPIIKDKLDFQNSIIHQINSAQEEADKLYSKALADLQLAEEELKKMELDTKNEKESLENDLLGMKNQLAKKIEDLDQLRVVEKSVCAEIKEAEESVALSEEKCAAMINRISEMTELQKTEKDKILQLQSQIEVEMQKNKKLKAKILPLQEEIEKTKLKGEAEVSCTEELLHSARNAYAALRKENMEYEQKVEDYKTKISESVKAVKQMREERKQMLQKISDNDEQWERAKEEMTLVVAQHSATQAKLEEQEQLTFMEEQKARKVIENLRKDLTGQVTALEQLKSECQNLKEEIYQHQKSSEETNQNLQKEHEDAFSMMKTLETKLKKTKELTEKLEKIQREHRETSDNLESEKKVKYNQLKAVKDLHTTTTKRYDDTVARISELTKKCEEYQDASDKMEKTAKTLFEEVAELESVFGVVEFKNKSAALIMSTLQSDINNSLRRTQRSMQVHTAHVTARKKEMEDTKEALNNALKENKQLACMYKHLKIILIEAKQDAASALSKKNCSHESFHYFTQLSLLQKRMHKALVKYFEQRSLYSQAELDRCQALSQETDQKIKTAQEGLSEEIHLISAFLQSLTDDSTSTDDAGVNKQASPDAAGSNE